MILFKWGNYLSEDPIKISNLTMRILFESGLYSNADSICDFTLRHITYFIYYIYTKYYIIAIFKSGHYLIVDCIKITNFLLGLYLSTTLFGTGLYWLLCGMFSIFQLSWHPQCGEFLKVLGAGVDAQLGTDFWKKSVIST